MSLSEMDRTSKRDLDVKSRCAVFIQTNQDDVQEKMCRKQQTPEKDAKPAKLSFRCCNQEDYLHTDWGQGPLVVVFLSDRFRQN